MKKSLNWLFAGAMGVMMVGCDSTDSNEPAKSQYKTVTVGSYENAASGSSLDLDEGKVLLVADAKKMGSGVDLVFTYNADYNGFIIFSPDWAENSGDIEVFKGWTNPNNTIFHQVDVNIDTITSKSQIQALFDESKADQEFTCKVGDVFVARTDKGNYALVKILSFDSTAAGTAQIKFIVL